ncbi:sulfate anion transporter 1 isoform X2 [Pan troglodytes]|uniref:sulfate anion transporter 1 isoform X2 n=1 Tax=Pan troglodytes TaxID=9598 RepID=UPI003013CCD0
MDESPEPLQQGRGPVPVRRQRPAPRGLREMLKARLWRSCSCSVLCARALVQDLLPATRWLRQYRPREYLAGDVMSGLVIGIILVPQAIAYSLLAGLQPIYSLYTSFFANLIYFLMGTSRHVSVGIFSLLCLMVGQVVDRELQLAGFDPSQDGLQPGANSSTLNGSAAMLDCGRDCYAIHVATALTLMTGLYQAFCPRWSGGWPPHPRRSPALACPPWPPLAPHLHGGQWAPCVGSRRKGLPSDTRGLNSEIKRAAARDKG